MKQQGDAQRDGGSGRLARPEGDPLVAQLVRAARSELDPNAVAAAVGGQRQRPDVAALARDPEAVLLMRRIDAARTRPRRLFWRGVAVAACLALGLVLYLQRGDPAEPGASASQRLASAVAEMTRAHPTELGDFALVPPEVLRAPAGRMRGGVAWIAPRGSIFEREVKLRWRSPDGATRVAVTLEGPKVRWGEEVEGGSASSPALGPGRYVVTLRALDGLAGQTTRRSFRVATDAERARYEAARSAWHTTAPEALRDVIEAHYAFSHGYYAAARAAAERAGRADADVRALVQPFLDHIPE